MRTNWLSYVRNFLVILCLTTGVALAGPGDDEQGVRVRVSLATEVLHGQGYWSPSVRVGQDGGWGLRVGSLRAPMWAKEVPDELIDANSKFKLNSASYLEVDREFCGQRWCGGLGVVYINDVTPMNGTKWNFGLHVRYAINVNWSLVFDHDSHGSMFGFAKDKSNRGWNLLGVAYTF